MTETRVPPPDRMPHGVDPNASGFDPNASGFGSGATAAQLALIAGALAASVVVYAGVAWFVTGEATAAGFEPSGMPGTARTALAVAGLALLLIAPVVERRIREGARGAPPEGALSGFRIATIVGFALREAAAMFGLLIAIFTGQPLWSFGFSAAALAAMLLAWPSRGRLERFVRGTVAPS